MFSTPCISVLTVPPPLQIAPAPCTRLAVSFHRAVGLLFGFLLGCVQAAIWWLLLEFRSTLEDSTLLPLWWFLPAAGAICGYVTKRSRWGSSSTPSNRSTCGLNAFRLHGLFLQRQAEVSEEFATITSSRGHCKALLGADPLGNRREQFLSRWCSGG